jgi:hypothetical protein
MMKFADKVQRVMKAESILPSELESMVASAVIASNMQGFNRRYHHWLFQVNNNVVADMAQAEMVSVGNGSSRMQEDCEVCEGKGCVLCAWRGQVFRMID